MFSRPENSVGKGDHGFERQLSSLFSADVRGKPTTSPRDLRLVGWVQTPSVSLPSPSCAECFRQSNGRQPPPRSSSETIRTPLSVQASLEVVDFEMPFTLTEVAFAAYRNGHTPRSPYPDAPQYQGDQERMTNADGLCAWSDGPVTTREAPSTIPKVSPTPKDCRLWVIMADSVLHALEHCAFGTARGAGKLKHTNLTGGVDAYAGCCQSNRNLSPVERKGP